MLLKGIEEEVLLGTRECLAEPLADHLARQDSRFITEPDSRNIEYVVGPSTDFDELAAGLLEKRRALRRALAERGDYTIIPGGVIPLDSQEEFHIADEGNPYYRFIRQAYSDRIVTASTQINIGVDDPEALFRVYPTLRREASMYLALSAASPFHRGRVTGYHSTRWRIFPKTPATVPLFGTHEEFVDWVEARLAAGEMFNTRHLWVSVRPNGPAPPRELDRLELRICDSVLEPERLRAITGLLESRVAYLLENEAPEGGSLEEIAANEAAAARSSLDCKLTDGRSMRDWIAQVAEVCGPLAEDAKGLLEEENPAQRWLRRVSQGESVEDVVRSEAEAAAQSDQRT